MRGREEALSFVCVQSAAFGEKTEGGFDVGLRGGVCNALDLQLLAFGPCCSHEGQCKCKSKSCLLPVDMQLENRLLAGLSLIRCEVSDRNEWTSVKLASRSFCTKMCVCVCA